MTAAYIHNRLVHTSTNGKTPMGLWSGVKPAVSHTRVFGCVCYAHVLHSKRTKTGVQSIKCLFIGYSVNSKGYRLYNIGNRRVTESRDVIFNENEILHNNIAPLPPVQHKSHIEMDNSNGWNIPASVSVPVPVI